ncbi:protein of unknown function [Candidatus Filomicrobium marinum]|nr:protein of unknown function [Candidatus Filomicrobium marinum]
MDIQSVWTAISLGANKRRRGPEGPAFIWCGPVAQLVEHPTLNRIVGSSNLPRSTKSRLRRRLISNVKFQFVAIR